MLFATNELQFVKYKIIFLFFIGCKKRYGLNNTVSDNILYNWQFSQHDAGDFQTLGCDF